jgi:hypothetical protein
MVRRLRVKSRRPYRKNKVMRVARSTKQPSARSTALRVFETKKKETRWGEQNINSFGGWFTNSACMSLTQGDSYASIEGHIIRGKGISYKGWFKNNASTTMVIRFGVMLVKQGSSSISTFVAGTNVLEGDASNANVTTADSVARMTQRFNRDQYKPVKEFMIKLGANNATDGSDVKPFKMWIPMNGYPFRYDGSATEPTRNIYSFFALNSLGNNDESLGDVVECSGTATFYYVDP